MSDSRYAYSTTPTWNPLRFLFALWRSVRDPADTREVAIVEMGFARSRIGRRFARWEEILDALRNDPRTARAVADRQPCEPIDLDLLGRLPERTLGRVFANHCRARGLNPNLGYIPPATEVDWLLNHLLQTHDLWHVVTGWGNDEVGEYGLGGFYLAQMAAPTFFGFLLALAALSTILRRRSFGDFIQAVVAGYEMGKGAEPLFGRDWATLWAVPLVDVRTRLGIVGESVIGDGIRTAA